jgi:hypothetical protein
VIAGTTKPNLASSAATTASWCPRTGLQAKCLALAVSHIVTDAPVETHVFASLLNRIDLYVTTSRGWWRVKGATVEFLGSLDDKKGK